MHLKESEKISAIKRVRQVIKNGMFKFGMNWKQDYVLLLGSRRGGRLCGSSD